jgi:hypothetical protein
MTLLLQLGATLLACTYCLWLVRVRESSSEALGLSHRGFTLMRWLVAAIGLVAVLYFVIVALRPT